MLRWASEQVSIAAAATPDLDISAVALLYRHEQLAGTEAGTS